MVKLINIGGIQASPAKNRVVDLSSAYKIIDRNVQERAKSAAIDAMRQEAAFSAEEARKMGTPWGITKTVAGDLSGMAKEAGKGFVGTTAAVGADVVNLFRKPLGMDSIKKVNMFGNDYITPSERGTRAGVLAGQGEYKKAAGELGTAGLDIVSTVWLPGKGFKLLSGGKFVKGAVEGAVVGAQYGAGYSATGAASEGKSGTDIAKETGKGALFGLGGGLVLGGATSATGKLFKRQIEIAEKPQAFAEIVGKPKNAVDYMATRPNLKIVEVKNLGKDIEGGAIHSRLEWDYKNNSGILLMTKKTTDDVFAHEIGHYIDKANPELVNVYKKDIIKITGGKQNLNEDFAAAIKEIITNPEARKLSPGLTKEIEGMGLKLEEPVLPIKKAPEVAAKESLPAEMPVPKVETPSTSKFKKETPIQMPKESPLIAVARKIDHPTLSDTKISIIKNNIKDSKNGRISSFLHNVDFNKPLTSSDKQIIREIKKNKEIAGIFEPEIKKLEASFKPPASIQKQSLSIQESKKSSTAQDRKRITTPSSVVDNAKKIYKEEIKNGKTKAEATKNATEKIKKYEAVVDRLAEDVPIIERLKNARRLQGTTPRKKVKTDGVNWEHLNTSDDTKNLLDNIFQENKQFESVRPSRKNADIVEGARAVGIDVNNPKELDSLLKNMPNANTALKLKQSMVDSASDLMNYLKTVDTGMLTAEQAGKIQDKFLRTQSIAKAFSGLRTESSHLLRSMGIDVLEGENFADIASKLKMAGVEAGDNPLGFMRKTQELIQPTIGDKALAVWYNSILSGWKTWARNISDTASSMLTETISKAANPVTMLEVPRFVAGMLRALPNSLATAGRILTGKENIPGKMQYKNNYAPYFKNKKRNMMLTEISGRILSAQDVVFSNTIEEAAKTIRTFDKQMEKAGIQLNSRIALNDAINSHFSERVTYRNQALGNIGKISGGIAKTAGQVKGLKLLVPFTNVVANVIDRKVDYLPFVNLMRTFGKKYINGEADVIMKKSGISPRMYDNVRPVIAKRLRNQQLGRFSLGILTTAGAYSLMQAGGLSGGGPKDANEKKQLMDTGWRPFSLKIPNTKLWIPYNYFGPLSGIFGAVGSIGDAMKYGKEKDTVMSKVAEGLFGFSKTMLTQSFLSGVSDFFDVMSGRIAPANYLRDFITGLIPIPAMYSQTAALFDRRSPDIETWKEAINYKLGRTKDIPPRLNALGEEIRSDLIYGMTPSEEKNNLQKQFEDRGVRVTVPQKGTLLGQEPMTREQLFKYTIRRGELIKTNSEQILSAIDAKETNGDKDAEMTKWITKIGEEVKAEMKIEYDIVDTTTNQKGFFKTKPIRIIK